MMSLHLIIVALAVALLYILYRRLLPKPIPGIPYNKDAANRLLGDVPSTFELYNKGEEMFPWIMKQTIKHNSPIAQVFLRPFSPPTIIVADYRESQDILLRRTTEFDRSEMTADVFEGLIPENHVVLKSKDEKLKRQKHLTRDLNSPAFLYSVASLHACTMANMLIELWSLKTVLGQGNPFPAASDLLNWSVDLLFAQMVHLKCTSNYTEAQVRLLGDKQRFEQSQGNKFIDFPQALRPKCIGDFTVVMSSIYKTFGSPYPRIHHWILRQFPSFRRAKTRLDAFISAKITEATTRSLEAGSVKECFLDYMIERENEAANKKGEAPDYSARRFTDEALGNVVGGHDPTSSTVVWGLKYLCDNQQAQQTLRDRLAQAFPDSKTRLPTGEEMVRAHIPYLDATLEEFSRLAVVLPFIPRVTIKDSLILGHPIPKGSELLLFNSGPDFFEPSFEIPLHLRSESARSAKYQVGSWNQNDMQAFSPERWLKLDEAGHEFFDPTAGPMLTFGLGPRGCAGRKLAYMNMRILLVLLILNFELLKLPDGLNSYQVVEGMTRQPKQFFLRLQKIP